MCGVVPQMTALGKPELLQHLSLIINETRVQFTGFTPEGARGDGHTYTLDAFKQQAGALKAGLSDEDVRL